MRLVCPNCGAQYEVDDRVMPETGRDVQCSNCSHAWFQRPPSAEAEPEVDETPSPFDNIDDVVEDEPTSENDAPLTSSDTSDTDATESEPPAAAARPLDEGVRNILQEEAELERKAREAEKEGLETQTDLGLDDASPSASDRHQDLHEDVEDTSVAQDDLKGRDVLPDIEEINSTLDAPETNTADVGATSDAIETVESGKGGFRRGFVLVVVLACLLAILYIFAPTIGERVPALQPVMEQYLEIADRVRVGLEDMMRSAIGKMQGLLDQPESN